MSINPTTKAILFQIFFWGLVFLLNLGPDWQKFASTREVLEVGGTTTVLQGLVAFVALSYLVPNWLDRGQVVKFALFLLLVLFVAAGLNITLSYYYLEPTYPESYGKYYQTLSHLSFLERLGFSYMIKYIVFSKLPLFFFPAAVLIAVNYYRKQQVVLALREQKRAAELDALKRQLNPHFIFNTLNNIYALAIKRSDQAPDAVAKFSGILDYVLYRCNSEEVSLADEIVMIEDYVALEKLRFSDRLTVTFDKRIEEPARIAPLLFLTLIENAFKHGASQALERATVALSLVASNGRVEFEVSNTKPSINDSLSETLESGIGLSNLRRQLSLLYPDTHQLDVLETAGLYTVRLSIGVL
ncbi:MAG: histidine kinase [Pseudomonadota bacterium]